MNRSLGQLVGTIAVLVLTLAPASAGTEPCSGCSLLGDLSVVLASVEPSAPMVGDDVTFTFTVDARLPSGFDCSLNGSCAFVGGDPVLAGSDPPTVGSGGLIVRRRAAQAGVATVRLDLRGRTEEACQFEDESGCFTFFRPAFIVAFTGPLEIAVLEAPTATPTPTPMSTPTTRRTVEDDGCAIAGAPHTSLPALVGLLLPALLLVLARRR
ncbi:MAG: hypothetical protein ACRERC_19685 [Candidatus Binatia bacterium]